MGALLNIESIMMCPHGGMVSVVCSNMHAQVGGSPILRSSDTFTIAGCALSSAVPPQPCVMVNWVQPDARNQVSGDFTLSEDSVGFCVAANQAVQGTVLITPAQVQVSGL